MICQKCNQKEATIIYKQTINGSTKELALCQDCAAEVGILKQPKYTAQSSAYDLIASLFGESPRRTVNTNVCPLCGSSYREIAKSGKVGCAKCYEVFEGELRPTVTGIHGRTRHTGRAPKEYKARAEQKKKADELSAKLNEAIEKQEFEEAARLRDELKRMRGEA